MTTPTAASLLDEKEVLEEFISCYRHFTALWDSSSPDYLSKKKKEPGYEELLKILRRLNGESSVQDVKRKINSLRCCYRREIKKIRQSYDGYEPRLWWFHLMDFLKPVVNIESSRRFKEEDNVNDSLDDEEDEGEEASMLIHDDNMFTERYQTEDDVLGLEADPEPEPEPEISLRAKSQSRVQSNYTKSYQHPRPRVSEVDSLDKIREPRRRPNSNNREDHENDDNDDDDYVERKRRRCQRREDQAEIECELIGKRMAAHFRNMRPDQRLFAERIISDVLVYGRMNLLSLEARFLPGIVDASDR